MLIFHIIFAVVKISRLPKFLIIAAVKIALLLKFYIIVAVVKISLLPKFHIIVAVVVFINRPLTFNENCNSARDNATCSLVHRGQIERSGPMELKYTV